MARNITHIDIPRLALPTEELQAVGRRVTHHRTSFHLIHGGPRISQDALATEVGITRDALAKYERGERPAPIRVMQDIAFVLRVEPDLLTTQARRTFAPHAEAVAA